MIEWRKGEWPGMECSSNAALSNIVNIRELVVDFASESFTSLGYGIQEV